MKYRISDDWGFEENFKGVEDFRESFICQLDWELEFEDINEKEHKEWLSSFDEKLKSGEPFYEEVNGFYLEALEEE